LCKYKTLGSFEARRRRGERTGPPLPLPHHRIYQQLTIFQVVMDLKLPSGQIRSA
jgi:hypothetical protein